MVEKCLTSTITNNMINSVGKRMRVCACVCGCACTCICVCVCVCAFQRLISGDFSRLSSTLFFETGSLLEAWSSDWLHWLITELRESFYFCPHCARVPGAHLTPRFYLRSGDLNSGPRVCSAGSLLTEPSLGPREILI